MNTTSKILLSFVAALAISGAAYYLLLSEQPTELVELEQIEEIQPPTVALLEQATPEVEPEAEVNEPEVELVSEPEPKIQLPTLDESDEGWRHAAYRLSPRMVIWLSPEQQIRKWVAMVDNLANDQVPVNDRPLLYPVDTFMVTGEEDTLRFDRKNYSRSNSLVNTIVAIPPEQMAQQYRQWRPLLEQAFAELGYEDTFDERLAMAINQILAVENIEQPQALKQPAVFYLYRNNELEKASALEKLLWRMGPENTVKLQRYLKELKPLLTK